MATHPTILAWRIPWTEEPGGLQSMVLQRVGHDWARLGRRKDGCLTKGCQRGMNKEDAVHKYNGILLSYKKEQNCVICRDVYGPRDCHTEWNRSERGKQINIDAYMWYLEKWYRWCYLQNRNIDKLRTSIWTPGGKVEEWIEIGIDICAPLTCVCACARVFNHIWLSATPWTAARQAPLPMEFFRQK